MPKRSLNTGNAGSNDTKKIEQLNKAVEAMLSRADGKAPKAQSWHCASAADCRRPAQLAAPRVSRRD